MAVIVKGEDLTIEDVCKVAYEGEKVDFPEDKAFWERIEKSRKFLIDYIKLISDVVAI